MLFVCSGASCPRNRQFVDDSAPIVLSAQPSLEDVIRVVNANSARIHQLQSENATLQIRGRSLPSLDANYAVDRPRRFRLRAEKGLLGAVLDLGSNDEIYWMWAKHSDQPGVFWGRHAEFHSSAAREMLPVPPDWMIQALGIVELDPTGEHLGPDRNEAGQLELVTTERTPSGTMRKLTVIDETRGWVLQQHLFDSLQRPIASAIASGFQYDETSGASLPRNVEINLPPVELSFNLSTDRHIINSLTGDPEQLWAVPQMVNVPLVDLGDPARTSFRSAPSLVARRPQRVARRSNYREPVHRDPAIRRTPPFDRIR